MVLCQKCRKIHGKTAFLLPDRQFPGKASLKPLGFQPRLQNTEQNVGRRQSGVTAQLYFAERSKPAQLIETPFLHKKSCCRKIIFGSDFAQRLVI